MRIFVCAGTIELKNENFNEQARKIGKMLAQGGHTYVQGGRLVGLMGETLKEFCKISNNVEFVIPEFYAKYDIPTLTEFQPKAKITIVKNEAERLQQIITCDKIIVLPGGTGTLEEFVYSNETKRQKEHKAEIILVNYQGFYDAVLRQIENLCKLGYDKKDIINFKIVDSVEDLDL